MTAEKLQKLWNLATRNPNENEALVAARKFIRAINREQVSVHLYKGSPPASQEDIQRAINNAYKKGINDIMSIKVRDFRWKKSDKSTPKTTGFIAQELLATHPE